METKDKNAYLCSNTCEVHCWHLLPGLLQMLVFSHLEWQRMTSHECSHPST
ncbi:hypothetical protein AB205_0192940 [Aquarana catesbeiana]|uniref:Uncharacterized protein n=1 Tax=Aquarana catesbeiana TaxID=8400 RepID=A0A2G9SC17_AQUCT|nr:hypothetical protein AB205_0192940 [Aquarana catesbeiana]